jgi:prohibitin 1
MDHQGFEARPARFVVVVLAVAALGLLLSTSTSCVGTGQVGVVTRFGKVTGQVLSEGVNVVSPINFVHDMSIRTQEIKEVSETPSEEGLIFNLEVSLLYRLSPAAAAQVYQTIGTGYLETVVEPTFRSAIREVTSAHKAADLYSSARERVQSEIQDKVATGLQSRGIIIERVLLRDMKLPPTLKASIEGKQQAEQESQKMQFTIMKERQEAERKRIEAQGIADFQQIVTQGISDKLLEWKGIEATLELSKSGNAKVIVIGAGKGGLPLILGQQ